MRKIIYAILFAISSITLYNCESNALEPTNVKYITLNEFSKAVVVPENTAVDTQVKVFISPTPSSDTTLNLELTTTMTAENYTVPTSITIPANSNEATINVNIDDKSLKRTGETMSIKLASPDDYFTGEGKVDFDISVLCESDLAGSWTYIDGRAKTINITKTGEGKYTVDGDNNFGTNYSFNISDACSNLKVTGGELQRRFSIAVSGSGTVSDDKKQITLSYTVDGYFTNRTMTLTKN